FPHFPLSDAPLQGFRLYWKEKGTEKEQSVDVDGRSYLLEGLKKFQEYELRMLGYNRHGEGMGAEEIRVCTWAD
ncbi:DCC protein, partial [Molothrus ater]|nr:DCC protein [Molothrus ater]